ncbi:hypothetical protein VitviT2T_003804 [Vitis vinifera]|uniref:Retrovirus-related Pol polyprotein from transposon RE1 n=1 Tax=Vitis vinifera TaxID=29760 RepID=A0ABY9BNP0_VITVI|nr:hypothetical protein VitviT2T_003804 [Vitis vinifera]
MQVLNLKRDFESLTMQEDETITKYFDIIALIVNKIRSLGEEFPDARIVEKVLVTLPERFESKISSLKESRDLSQISLAELMNALQSQEQSRALRQENIIEVDAHNMCHNATIFKDLGKTYNSTMKVGNGGYVDVKGRGTIVVKTNSGIKLISDVLFVPDISQNLLSVGQMLEKQYSLQFKDNQCIIFYPYEKKLLSVKMKSKSFTINWENDAKYAYARVTQSVSDLWHKRFGHYNQRSLVELKKLELVEDMPNVSNEAQIYDMLVIGNQPGLIQSFKDEMNKVFEMTDLGVMKYFLGMEVMQSCLGIFICQQKYAMDMLKKFKMQDCKPVSTPMTTNEKLSKDDDSEKIDEDLYRSLIGSLLYLTTIRPDILFAVSVLSMFMHSPSEKHFSATKRVLRYIKGTIALGVQFSKSAEGDLKLLGYSDNDWGVVLMIQEVLQDTYSP